MGTQNGDNVPFLGSASLRKRKQSKQTFIKYQRVIIKKKKKKKTIMPSGPLGGDRPPILLQRDGNVLERAARRSAFGCNGK